MIRKHFRVEASNDSQFAFLSFQRPGFHSSSGIKLGDFVIDFFNQEFVGLEIERASSVFDSLFGESLDLGSLIGAKISIENKNTLMFLSLVFSCRVKHYKKEIVIPKTQAMPLSV